MNKYIKVFLLIFLCPVITFTQIEDIYRRSSIKLKADVKFGKDTDWETLFYDNRLDMAVATDCIFIADINKHRMLKFDWNGKLVKTFSQKGKGPGDLYYPSKLSILDNKFLVVGENGHRFSIFNLEGKFVKVVDLAKPYVNLVALKNNKVAYLCSKVMGGNKVLLVYRYTLIIRDLSTGKEKNIKTFDLEKKGQITFDTKSGPFMYGVENFLGEPYLKCTSGGNLLFGVSNSPNLTLYSAEGEKIKVITLNISPVKATRELEEKYKKKWIEDVKQWNWADAEIKKGMIKGIPDVELFYEHLPFYKNLSVDEAGNILAFKYQLFDNNIIEIFSTSYQGEFIGKSKIEIDNYEYLLDTHLVQFHFGKTYILALVKVQDSEDPYYRIIKAPALGDGA